MSPAKHAHVSPSGPPPDYRSAAFPRLQIATGAGLILFWSLFFTIGLAPANPPPGYFEFEHSFTVPDLLLAAGLIYAGLQWRDPMGNRHVARTLSLLCAGALIFLGLLDTSFNIRSGIYTANLADAVGALAINLWCLGFGGYLAIKVTAHERDGPDEPVRSLE
jgi:hypothetical protein